MEKTKKKGGCLKTIGIVFAIFIGLAILGAALGGGDDEATTTETPVATQPETNEEETNATETEEETTEETAAEEEEKEEAPALAGIGEQIDVEGVYFTVNEISTATNVGGDYGQDAQSQFTIINVTIQNEKNEPITVDSSFFTLLSGERKYDADGTAGIYANEDADFFLTSVNPGVSITGNVVFDVPADLADPILQVQTGFWGTETGQISLK